MAFGVVALPDGLQIGYFPRSTRSFQTYFALRMKRHLLWLEPCKQFTIPHHPQTSEIPKIDSDALDVDLPD